MFARHFSTLIAILAVAICAHAQIQPSAADIAAKTDEYMNALLKVKGVGGTVLISRNGERIVNRGYGYADAAAKVPNAPNTKFRIGSITKQFTAAAVLLLQEMGKLSVNDPACKYLEDCPETWKQVTIHQLLSHMSGITNFTALPEFRTKQFEDLKPYDVLAMVKSLPLRSTPGEKFEYSNTNYTILGIIIEKTSGKTYDAFLKESIFDRLKLTDTGYDFGKARLPNAALGYSKRGDKIIPAAAISMQVPYAAGALYSTVGNLYKWQEALIGGELLRPESLAAMLSPNQTGYGYGIGIRNTGGRERIAHDGGIDGFSSNLAIFRSEKVVVIVLTNNDAGMANAISRDLESIVFGEKYAVPQERKTVNVDAKLLDSYAGQYQVAPGLIFSIARTANGLTFQPTGQPNAAEMFAESDSRFFLKVVDAQITFVKGADGKVTGLEFQQAGRTTKATRKE